MFEAYAVMHVNMIDNQNTIYWYARRFLELVTVKRQERFTKRNSCGKLMASMYTFTSGNIVHHKTEGRASLDITFCRHHVSDCRKKINVENAWYKRCLLK